MAPRTILAALCAMAFGVMARSPIPVVNNEPLDLDTWNTITRDPAFRLPLTTAPSHYVVSITPYFEHTNADLAFTFDGITTIYLSAQQDNVNEIVMHCNEITIQAVPTVNIIVNGVAVPVATDNVIPVCDPIYNFLRINVLTPLVLNQEYSVNIVYRGVINNNMRGFYRSWYYDSTGTKRWMGTTQFQPGHARQAFPCYDEPGFKATFDITINRESDFSPSISNMPIYTTGQQDANGRIAETFYTTPVMSTYLIAFIVSHYQVSNSTTEGDPRPFQIIARDNIGNTGDWAFEVGVELLEYMEEYTNISYYGMALNMDMKQVAIPDFSAGAMENWGLLTYREALILYDPDNSNHFYRQRVPNIVSHEIAHMWFGNLVTCDWWENLWLNEGFARFYQYYLTGAVRPELGFETRFITEQLHVAMLSDSVDTAHALTNTDVNTPVQVSAHFSTITYARGAGVIRMTQHLLGDETFVKALRNYLRDRQYDVASPQDLFDALDAAAVDDNSLTTYPGLTISEYFKTWSEKAGHPILTVVIDHEVGRMIVTQSRWERDTGVSQYPSLWQIPITWTRQTNADFQDTKPSEVLTEQVTLIDRGSTGYEWVIFNKQQSGFYRVNYDDTTWGLITLALRGPERTNIHEYNRAQIVDDVFNLARAGVMSYTRALNILSFLQYETDYAPWLAAITGFNFLRGRLAYDANALEELHNTIIQLSSAVTARLGFADVDTDTYMDGLLRMYVMTLLCDVGHPECVAEAQQNFQNLRNGQAIHGNMRPWVYCSGLRYGTAEDFNFLWAHYLQEDLAGEKVVLLQTLGCTQDPDSLVLFLNEVIADTDSVRPQDYSTALYSATYSNEVNTWVVFNWIQNNSAAVIEGLGSLATPLSYVAARLRSEQQIAEFELWLNANPTLPGVATGISGANTARTNLAWSAERLPQLTEYFENGYQDFEIPSATEEPDTEVTEEPIVDPDTEEDGDSDSANVAQLGFVTLVITMFINYMNY